MTFPKLLHKAGYYTTVIGKWHLFTEPSGCDYYNVLPEQGLYFDPVFKEKSKRWQDGEEGGEIYEGIDIPEPDNLFDDYNDPAFAKVVEELKAEL